ncbi:DUF6643 family protein [Streptomyces rimosus]|uniref:DUF6643 family protein n=1 Tax=Streptomyces rimosus TaxID=1927 RepID=UPI0004C70EC5|nr:DUF6643 family protein [Streptomyces rimosus]
MTSPRSTYGGGYYASPSFPDTPIYDSLVAERGTPQIAPIRVELPYDTGSSYMPALPSALPALPAAPSQPQPGPGYPGAAAQPVAPLQSTPAPYIPQQAGSRGYQPQQQQPPRPAGNNVGYDAMRPAGPVAPRPAPSPYDDPYGRQYPRGY